MKETIEQILFFQRDSVKITETLTGIKIALKGCKPAGDPGTPSFPAKEIRVALPLNRKAVSVKEEVLRSSKLTSGFTLVDCNQERSFVYLDKDHNLVTSGRPMALPDKVSYEKAIREPRDIVALSKTDWISSVPVALLTVTPVRYQSDGTIEIAEIIKVTVEVESFHYKNPVPLKIRMKQDQNLGKLHRLVANPRLVESIKLKKDEVVDMEDHHKVIHEKNLKLKSRDLLPDEIDYLIITDNNRWDATTMTPSTNVGDMVAEFQRLSNWKHQRGLRSRIVTVKDIADGVYGNFKTGALDLQEVIRNFLKHYCAIKGVQWVLLGGDVNIIPVRKVCSSAWGVIGRGKENTGAPAPGSLPDGVLSGDNTTAWKGTYLAMQVKEWSSGNPEFGQAGHVLAIYETGVIIPFDATGASNTTTPGWYFTTDDTFSTRSVARTRWIRVNGPAATINKNVIWYTNTNQIPTDLYYSSLYSSFYVAGKHDWYHLNNGLFGQHSHHDPHLSGIDYIANIGLGRAPVQTPAEAKVFVDKVLAYEQWDQNPPADYLERFKKMLYVSDHWGSFIRIHPDVANANPPVNGRYFSNPAGGYSLLRMDTLPPDAGQKLICHISDWNRKVMKYTSKASKTTPGWYYAISKDNLSPSRFVWNFVFMEIDIPIPTPWIVFYGANNAELTPIYFALDFEGADSSVTQQETLREWMQSNYHEIDQVQRLYTDETDLEPAAYNETSIRHLTADNLKTCMNEGPHFISFTGHGNSDWVAYLTTGLVNTLVNGNKTSIIYADSCLTNQFDEEDSVGENSIKHPNGGAVAYVGNSRFSWIGLGDQFRLEFFKGIIHSRHLADLNDTRCVYGGNSNDTGFLWAVLSLNLNGDPEMPVFRTWKDAVPLFIGNRNSYELHRSTCPWVEKMSFFNMLNFPSKEAGLAAGFDGCYYCLRQHHTK